jgi:hypothetical protein
MKPITQKMKVNVPNRHSARNARLTYTQNTYYIYGMVYGNQEGIRSDASGRARIRDVQVRMAKHFFPVGNSKINKNIVSIPVFKKVSIPLEVEMPSTVPSGTYYLRILQISASPRSLEPLKNPNDREALRVLITLLRDQQQKQNLVHEQIIEFNFKNKEIDKNISAITKEITFYTNRFEKAVATNPDEVIKALILTPGKMKLKQLPKLWENSMKLYKAIPIEHKNPKDRIAAEEAYNDVKDPEALKLSILQTASTRPGMNFLFLDEAKTKINTKAVNSPEIVQKLEADFKVKFFTPMQDVLNFCKDVVIKFNEYFKNTPQTPEVDVEREYSNAT